MGAAASDASWTSKQPICTHPLYAVLRDQRIQQIGHECLEQYHAGEPFVLFPVLTFTVPNPDYTLYANEDIPFAHVAAHLKTVLPCAFTMNLVPRFLAYGTLSVESYCVVTFVLNGTAPAENLITDS